MRKASNLPPGVTERMIPGNEPDDYDDHTGQPDAEVEEFDPACPHCGLRVEQHRETSVEDQYGNDYEILACPPEDCREGEALAHFLKHGCTDLMRVEGREHPWPYCEGCGVDLAPLQTEPVDAGLGTCAKCGSKDLDGTELLVGVPFRLRSGLRCVQCGHTWTTV